MANYFNTVGADIAQNALRGQGIDPSGLDEAGLIAGLQQIFPDEQFRITGYTPPAATTSAVASPLVQATTKFTDAASNPTGGLAQSTMTDPAFTSGYVAAPGGEGEIYAPNNSTLQSLNPTTTTAPDNKSSQNTAVGYGALVDQLGGSNPASNAIAQGLLNQGVGDINNIGVRTVNETRYYPAIDDVSAERTEEVPVTQFYNKATGQTINGERVGIIQNGTNGVDGGDVFYNLRVDANGNPTIETKFSPRAGGFIWSNPVGQLALTAAKMFPATAPFAFGLDAAHSLANEQYLNAALSAIGGANSVLNSGVFMPDSVASDAMSSTIGSVSPDVFAGQAQGTLGQISTGLQLGKAIDDKQ
jgi:hypothetical protein